MAVRCGMRFLAVLAVLGTVGWASSVASADTVTFYTSGVFSGSPSLFATAVDNAADPNNLATPNAWVISNSNGSGDSYVNFYRIPDTAPYSEVDFPSNVPLGRLRVGSNSTNQDYFDGVSFALTVTQTDPAGTYTADATLTGRVRGSSGGNVEVVFDTPTFTIPGDASLPSATYTILNNGVVPLSRDQSIYIYANLTYNGTNPAPVPLPAAVWGGMAMFGLLGLRRCRAARALGQ
jgi:hypothetical protein